MRSPIDADFNIWEGVYASYEEAASLAHGAGFSSDAWVERSRDRLRKTLAEPPETFLETSAYLLPVVVAVLDRAPGKLRILDFGGGPGAGFQSLRAAPCFDAGVEYHLVDNPAVIALARECFGGDRRLVLHERLPEPFPVDLIHLGSCVQYLSDLDGTLRSLSDFAPRVVLFSDVFAGAIDEYWTLQNLWGSRVPFHFMSETKFVETVESHGFHLKLSVPYIATILGKNDPLPMRHLPPERQIKRSKHYLFLRQ